MTPSEIERRILERLPDSAVTLRDLTGTADHWEVTVVSGRFKGRPLLERHRILKGFFEAELASGDLHALSLKTYTPEEWSQKNR